MGLGLAVVSAHPRQSLHQRLGVWLALGDRQMARLLCRQHGDRRRYRRRLAHGGDKRHRRQVPRQLDAFPGKQDASPVAAAWPHLGTEDRTLRYAARIALESQPVASWLPMMAKEKNPRAALTAALGLARVGPRESQAELLK